MPIEGTEAHRVSRSGRFTFSDLWIFLNEGVPEVMARVGSKIEKNNIPTIVAIMIFAFVIHLTIFHPNSNVVNDTISKARISDHFYETGEYKGTHYMPVYPLLIGLTGTEEYNIHVLQMALLEILIFGRWYIITNDIVTEKSTLVKAIDIVNGVNQTTVYTNQNFELEYFGTPYEIVIVKLSQIQDLPNGSLVFIYEGTDNHYTDDYLFKEFGDNGYFKVFYKYI